MLYFHTVERRKNLVSTSFAHFGDERNWGFGKCRNAVNKPGEKGLNTRGSIRAALTRAAARSSQKLSTPCSNGTNSHEYAIST